MKRSIANLCIVLMLLLSFSFAATFVRGGARGSAVSMGIEDCNDLSWDYWSTGYGVELTTGPCAVLGYLSFNKIIAKAADKVPVYLSFGPVLGAGATVSAGGFMHLGFDNIFDTQRMFAELGVEAMTPRGTGVCLELGYRL